MYKLEKKITILGVLRSFFLPFFSKFPREWKYNTSKLKEISAHPPCVVSRTSSKLNTSVFSEEALHSFPPHYLFLTVTSSFWFWKFSLLIPLSHFNPAFLEQVKDKGE